MAQPTQLMEIESAQKSLEECFTRRMNELEAQLHTGGPAKDTVARVAEEFRTFRELMFNMLNLLRQQISECHRAVDSIETRHRRKALIFLGIREVENEDCTNIILDVVYNKLALKDISASHITVCHRLGAQNPARSRPILVRFNCLNQRSCVWRAKGALKGSTVSVREFLTKPRQAVFGRARQHFGMRAVWTQEGSIVIKTKDGRRHKITSIDELNPLAVKYPATGGASPAARPCDGVVGSTATNKCASRK